MGCKRGGKGKSNNDRNKTNAIQPRPGFVQPVGDKSKNTRKGGIEETDKCIPKKKNVGVLPLDNDTDPYVDEETREKNDEDERTNDEDVPPDDDTEVCRIQETEENAVKESDHEESPNTEKSPDNYSIYLHLPRRKRNKY